MWNARQTTRVLRRCAAIHLAHSGIFARPLRLRSFGPRTWCTSDALPRAAECAGTGEKPFEQFRPSVLSLRFDVV